MPVRSSRETVSPVRRPVTSPLGVRWCGRADSLDTVTALTRRAAARPAGPMDRPRRIPRGLHGADGLVHGCRPATPRPGLLQPPVPGHRRPVLVGACEHPLVTAGVAPARRSDSARHGRQRLLHAHPGRPRRRRADGQRRSLPCLPRRRHHRPGAADPRPPAPCRAHRLAGRARDRTRLGRGRRGPRPPRRCSDSNHRCRPRPSPTSPIPSPIP